MADAPEEVEEDVDSDYASSDKEVEYDFEDDEVASTQKNFNPIEGGSLGSFIAYMSDDSDTECEVPQSEMMIDASQAWDEVEETPAMEKNNKNNKNGFVKDTHFDKEISCEGVRKSGSSQNLDLFLENSNGESDKMSKESDKSSKDISLIDLDSSPEKEADEKGLHTDSVKTKLPGVLSDMFRRIAPQDSDVTVGVVKSDTVKEGTSAGNKAPDKKQEDTSTKSMEIKDKTNAGNESDTRVGQI